MTNVSTKYFNTLSPLFDAALCTSTRLHSAVQKMASIIMDYNDSWIQAFHMLSSSPMTMSMTFKFHIRSGSQWNETTVESISIILHSSNFMILESQENTDSAGFLERNGLLHVMCSPVNFVQVYQHRSSWWSFWSIRWGGNYNSLASLS